MRLQKIFERTDGGSGDLEHRVASRLNQAIKKDCLKKTVFSAVGIAGGALAFLLAAKDLLGALNNSGFYQYLRLFFSDFSLSVSRPEVGVVLAESFPVVSTTLVLITVLLVILAVRLKNEAANEKFISLRI